MPGWESLELWLSEIQGQALTWAVRLAAALLVLLLSRVIARRTGRAVDRLLGKFRLQQELRQIFSRLARLTIWLLGAIGVLLLFGMDQLAISFLAGLGISGLILGFALQDITKNLAAGLLLLVQQPFKLGERIAVKEFEGVVGDIALRATTLKLDDGREVLVPNAEVYTSVIVHLGRSSLRRHSLVLKLATHVPLAEALPALEQTLQQIEQIQQQPPPQALVTALDETLTVQLRYWLPARNIDALEVQSAAAKNIYALAGSKGWIKKSG